MRCRSNLAGAVVEAWRLRLDLSSRWDPEEDTRGSEDAPAKVEVGPALEGMVQTHVDDGHRSVEAAEAVEVLEDGGKVDIVKEAAAREGERLLKVSQDGGADHGHDGRDPLTMDQSRDEVACCHALGPCLRVYMYMNTRVKARGQPAETVRQPARLWRPWSRALGRLQPFTGQARYVVWRGST